MKRNVLDKHRGLLYLPSQLKPYTAPSINLPVWHTHVFSTCAAVSVTTSTPTCVYKFIQHVHLHTGDPVFKFQPVRLPNGKDCAGSGVELSSEKIYSHSNLRCPSTVSQGRTWELAVNTNINTMLGRQEMRRGGNKSDCVVSCVQLPICTAE